MKFLSTANMSHEEWLHLRHFSVGGSEASVVVKKDKYRSPRMLWDEKLGRPREFSQQSLVKMEWGNRIEGPICSKAEEELKKENPNIRVRKDNKIRIHKNFAFITANLDRVIYGLNAPGVLEAKYVSQRVVDTWPDGQRYEQSWFYQVQHQLAVTGWAWGYIAFLVKETSHFELVRIDRDEEVIQEIEEACQTFWDYVVRRAAPPRIELDAPHIKALPGEIKMDVNQETNNWLYEIDKLAAEEKQTQAKLKSLKAKVQIFMGSAEFLLDENESIIATWKEGKDGVRRFKNRIAV